MKKEKEKKLLLYNNVADLCTCSMTFEKYASIHNQVHTLLHIKQYVFIWKYCVATTCLKLKLCQDLQDFDIHRCVCLCIFVCFFIFLCACTHLMP